MLIARRYTGTAYGYADFNSDPSLLQSVSVCRSRFAGDDHRADSRCGYIRIFRDAVFEADPVNSTADIVPTLFNTPLSRDILFGRN